MDERASRGEPSMPEPRFRHEFVGMMFAVTIGEVGLQTASLVRAGGLVQNLSAISHLILATVVIATSWVGWSLSRAPGAQLDVKGIFEWEFLVLLLDVVLVIFYFILVRTVDFNIEGHPHIDPPAIVAFWIVVIFWLYLLWDILTKFFIEQKDRATLERIIPTVGCLILAYIAKHLIAKADYPHWVTGDLALLSLVLLFRALKARSWPWSFVCSLGLVVGVVWTRYGWRLA